MLRKIKRVQKIFGVTSFIAGTIIISVAFTPLCIPLIIIGGYFFLNGLSNILIKID